MFFISLYTGYVNINSHSSFWGGQTNGDIYKSRSKPSGMSSEAEKVHRNPKRVGGGFQENIRLAQRIRMKLGAARREEYVVFKSTGRGTGQKQFFLYVESG